MSHHFLRSMLWAGAAALLLVGSIGLGAQGQTEFANNIKFNSGQDIQPVYEGWAPVADGSFNLYFGYLNRNWVEQLQIPVGPNNNIQPGGPDRGQPTYFYTRTNRKVFTVNVPKDFGKTELVWTLTVNGRTRTTYGHLRADWEITPDGGSEGTRTTTEARTNKPPTITVGSVGSVQLPGTATLVATVSDDGLPVPRPAVKAAVGQETPPTLTGGEKSPVNLPWLEESSSKRPKGLTVTWFVFRGPADVHFAPQYAEPKDGKTTTTAVFTAPGDYILRGRAEDGYLATDRDVPIKVTKR